MEKNEAVFKRTIGQIAAEAMQDWAKPSYAARPYVLAMLSIEWLAVPVPQHGGGVKWIRTRFGCDESGDVVERFLCNAGTWRGEVARRCKQELRDHLAFVNSRC